MCGRGEGSILWLSKKHHTVMQKTKLRMWFQVVMSSHLLKGSLFSLALKVSQASIISLNSIKWPRQPGLGLVMKVGSPACGRRVGAWWSWGLFSGTPLLRVYFHIRCHCVKLLFCCHLSRSINMWWNTGGKVQTPAAIPPTFVSHFVDQQNKIGGSTFRIFTSRERQACFVCVSTQQQKWLKLSL